MGAWRLPTPHEVLGAIVLIAYAAEQGGLCPPGTKREMAAHLVMVIAGLLGISAAKGYQSPHVKEVLKDHDDQVKEALKEAAKSVLPFLLPFAALMALSGCYCSNALHAQEPRCILQQQSIDCTKGAAAGDIVKAIPIVTNAWNAITAGGSFDWAAVVGNLIGLGIADADCVVSAIVNDFFKGKLGASMVKEGDGEKMKASWTKYILKKRHKDKVNLPAGAVLK